MIFLLLHLSLSASANGVTLHSISQTRNLLNYPPFLIGLQGHKFIKNSRLAFLFIPTVTVLGLGLLSCLNCHSWSVLHSRWQIIFHKHFKHQLCLALEIIFVFVSSARHTIALVSLKVSLYCQLN